MSNHDTSSADSRLTVDALVIGGGPAGLQAAVTLGRVHRSALLVDSGAPRNAPARHMHNFLTHDGTDPAQFRSKARAELETLEDVTLRDGTVTDVAQDGDGFVATLADGEQVRARCVVLTTGMRDNLPDVPGLADGTTELLDGFFTPTDLTPSAPHATQLGLELNPSGAVAIDVVGRTSVQGVFAGGDGAHHRDLPMPMASVLAAAAAGQAAAVSCVASLLPH